MISIALNVVFGSGLLVTLRTMKSVKIEAAANAKKAEAEAQTSEINNVDAVSKMWRELAEKMAAKHHDLTEQVEELHIEVRRLKNATNRVARLLDRITPENMSDVIDEIKKEIDNEDEGVRTSVINVRGLQNTKTPGRSAG